MPFQSAGQNALILLICSLGLFLCNLSNSAEDEERRSLTQSIADGEIHDCQIISIDRLVAVGDRGLILMSENGGKTWSVRNTRSDFCLYGVHFSSELDGCVVGGMIEPMSLRSRGIALLTNDGGRTWRSSKSDLPRLTGVVSQGGKRLISWGDWSNPNQSALFESVDSGESWHPLVSPCGHIESVGVVNESSVRSHSSSQRPITMGTSTKLIVVDRLSRCFRSPDGLTYERFGLSSESSDVPIRFCTYDGTRWWLCGEQGQLYSSLDGYDWTPHKLPGTPLDQQLYSLRHVQSFGDHVWVAGDPGSIVWHSSDGGITWTTFTTGLKQPIPSLSISNGQILMACGPLATISLSRNGGKAWRLSHQSASRVSTLNLASTADSIAWDLLAVISRDSRQATSCIVVHDQNIEQRTSHVPEQSSRIQLASKRIDVSSAQTWPMFRVSDAISEPRRSDLAYYAELGNIHQASNNALFRRLIHEIRRQQPDLLVTDCAQSGSLVQHKLSELVDLAVSWASRRDYELFSAASGVPNNVWQVQRTLYRGDKPGGRQFVPSTLLKNTGMILGEVLAPVHGIAWGRLRLHESSKASYRMVGSKQTNILNPLEGLALSHNSQLTEKRFGSTRNGLLMMTANWFNLNQHLSHQTASPFVRDLEWETKLQQACKGIEPEARAAVLLQIANEYRRNGQWNLWTSSLELLLAGDNRSPYAEAALHELLKHLGSIEVNQMVGAQLRLSEKSSNETGDETNSIALLSSPFGKENDSSVVIPASFAHAPRRIPIATQAGLPEFHRLLAGFPEEWRTKRTDPEWAWLIASRFRAHRTIKDQGKNGTDLSQLQIRSSNFWPQFSQNLLSWQTVFLQESKLLSPEEFLHSEKRAEIPKLTEVNSRPHLDGYGFEPLWSQSQRLELSDVWGGSGVTTIRLARDDEFLYIFSETKENAESTPGLSLKQRDRDSLTEATDQVRIRVDLDRDYCSWFELGWNRNGETIDLCNDMRQWNPVWYVATAATAQGWNAEIAIPIEELFSSNNLLSRNLSHIGLNALHSIPGQGSRTLSPAISDRFQQDQWQLFKW